MGFLGDMNECNGNYLRGLQCPQCSAREPFEIKVSANLTVHDDTFTDVVDVTWDKESPCYCPTCGYFSKVTFFNIVGA